MSRDISNNGLKFTATWEQLRTKAYRATQNEKYLTIGYGHYGPDVKPGDTITADGALNLLYKDMAKAVRKASELVHPSFNQAQFDAIVDLCFNVGTSVIEKDNVLGDFDDAVRLGDIPKAREIMGQFIYQNKKPLLGLKRRAVGRIALFDGKSWLEAEAIGRGVKSL